MFEYAVEFDVHGGEDLRIDPVFDRHRKNDGFEGCRFGRQPEGFMEFLEAGFRFRCAIDVELGHAGYLMARHIVNEVKDLRFRMKLAGFW